VLGVITVLVLVTISMVITRIATAALIATGMSSELARFQARSAFSGVGFTTSESESVVQQPVRRRIILALMLLGNAGIVTTVASLLLGFAGVRGAGSAAMRIGTLLGGLVALWLLARSQLVQRVTQRAVDWALRRWTTLTVRDYARLLRVAGEYDVVEMEVERKDWLAGRELHELDLPEEGVLVLAMRRTDGTFLGAPTGRTDVRPGDVVLLYGREDVLADLDTRRAGPAGEHAHEVAAAMQEEREAEEQARDASTRSS